MAAAALSRLLRSARSNIPTTTTARSFSFLSTSAEPRFPPPPLAAATERKRRDPSTRGVQWVLLGCPGVGKGTYASRLSNLIGVPHIATGDLVRDELNSAGPLAKKLAEIVNQGKLVSDEIIVNLLSKRLEEGEAKGESRFILDGFPRTVRQVEMLEGVTDIDLVVNLRTREDVLTTREMPWAEDLQPVWRKLQCC